MNGIKEIKMTWIKTEEQLPKDEQWCWIYIPENVVLCASYCLRNDDWYIPGLDYVCASTVPTHWQPYFTPKAPDPDEKYQELKTKLKAQMPEHANNIDEVMPDRETCGGDEICGCGSIICGEYSTPTSRCMDCKRGIK